MYIHTTMLYIFYHQLFDYYYRKKRLEESCQYQQFCVGVDEEEAWLNEKTALLSSEEVGDTLATVQVQRKNKKSHSQGTLLTYHNEPFSWNWPGWG